MIFYFINSSFTWDSPFHFTWNLDTTYHNPKHAHNLKSVTAAMIALQSARLPNFFQSEDIFKNCKWINNCLSLFYPVSVTSVNALLHRYHIDCWERGREGKRIVLGRHVSKCAYKSCGKRWASKLSQFCQTKICHLSYTTLLVQKPKGPSWCKVQ